MQGMPSDPVTAATDEVGLLSRLTRSELAELWVWTLKRAAEEERELGRRHVWDRVGRRDDVRVVMREFNRRARLLEEERHEYLNQIERLNVLGPVLDALPAHAL